MVLLLGSSASWAQEAATRPALPDGTKLLRLYVESATLAGPMAAEVRPLVFKTPVAPKICLDIAISKSDANFLAIDEKASKLTAFNDDASTNLMDGAGIWAPACRGGISDGGSTCWVRVQSAKGPGKGASEVTVKGTVVVLCGKDEKSTLLKQVDVGATVNLSAGPVRATLAFDHEDCLLIGQDLEAVKSVAFVTAQGAEIATTMTRMGSSSQHKPMRVYHPAEPIKGKLDMRVTYWNVVEPQKLAMEIKTGVGCGPAVKAATAPALPHVAAGNKQAGMSILWLLFEDPALVQAIAEEDIGHAPCFAQAASAGARTWICGKVSDSKKSFVRLDPAASKLESARDDTDSDLLPKDADAAGVFEQLYISEDRHDCVFTIATKALPGSGARHLMIKGTAAAAATTDLQQATFEFGDSKPMIGKLSLQRFLPCDGGGIDLELSCNDPLDSIADIHFIGQWDGLGPRPKDITCHFKRAWEEPNPKWGGRYRRRYSLMGNTIPNHGIFHVRYADKTEIVSLPIEATITIAP
jgi:hypothetical protein